jgi:hypothetical protein
LPVVDVAVLIYVDDILALCGVDDVDQVPERIGVVVMTRVAPALDVFRNELAHSLVQREI